MSLGALVLQEYIYGVYQSGTPSTDPNIIHIQHFLYISDSPFSSSEFLTLDLLLPPSVTPMNITLLYYPISSIPNTYQVTSSSPIDDQFPMDTRRKIHVLSIDNDEPELTATASHIIRDRPKHYISLSIKITLS